MAVVLAYTSPAIGHLFPFCALLSELASRGHRVHVRTLDAGVDLCRRLGFAAERVDPRIESLQSDDWTTGSALRVVGKTVEMLARRAAIEVADIDAAIRDVKPDVVLVDANCWGAISTLEAQRTGEFRGSSSVPSSRTSTVRDHRRSAPERRPARDGSAGCGTSESGP